MAKNQCRNAFQFELDAMKASLYTALMAADSKAMLKDSSAAVIFYRRPDVVYSSKNISKGALTLIPMVPLNNISTIKSPTAISLSLHTVGDQDVDVCLTTSEASMEPSGSK